MVDNSHTITKYDGFGRYRGVTKGSKAKGPPPTLNLAC